jgi:hypothetical protein
MKHHLHLRHEYVNQNITFEDLTFNLFVAGEFEILTDPQNDIIERVLSLC